MQNEYPSDVIDKGIHNAKLQGPAPQKENCRVIPLISTYFSNYDNGTVLQIAKNLINNSKDERIKSAYKGVKLIHAYRQPPNLLRMISNSAFVDNSNQVNKKVGCFKCSHKGCKICRIYLQNCKSFVTANGTTWDVRCFINCNSLNVIYYLVCCFCEQQGALTSYTGITDDLRERTNNHITGCRHGMTSNKLDRHVYNCARARNLPANEPYFRMYMFMALSDYNKLRNYERKLHAQGHDTLNRITLSD